MWLEFDGHHTIVVNMKNYISSQPVGYHQISDVMDRIRGNALPVYTYIDISDLNVSDVDITCLIDLVWDLHEKTKNEKILKQICFIGASRRVLVTWRTIAPLVPTFVSELIIFE
jgi:hypothetical protein